MSWSSSSTVAHLLLVSLAAGTPAMAAQETGSEFPTRVLITNDNGIEDTGLVELARAFAREPGVDVYVVAPARDRSGTSNFLGATVEGRFVVRKRDLGPGIQAWALTGYPADCVVFALSGPLREKLPDVVVSGINGGPNLGDAWFGSGTIGAARTAAYFGVPAVAVSGVEDDHPGAVEAATSWVARFVRSDLVASLEAPEYLTVSLPVGAPPEIHGARIVERARGTIDVRTRLVERGTDSLATWTVRLSPAPERAPRGTDVSSVADGFIAIVPMRADEFDAGLARRLRARRSRIPGWTGAEGEAGSAHAVRDLPPDTPIDDAVASAEGDGGAVAVGGDPPQKVTPRR